ncbi:hypothetical protein B0H14DRAFT_2614977 [Mycena olivaceomarginata]|nr:hypothetical protein B0H14DRAFT_2614977 [Mycena olivaceomarginata]
MHAMQSEGSQWMAKGSGCSHGSNPRQKAQKMQILPCFNSTRETCAGKSPSRWFERQPSCGRWWDWWATVGAPPKLHRWYKQLRVVFKRHGGTGQGATQEFRGHIRMAGCDLAKGLAICGMWDIGIFPYWDRQMCAGTHYLRRCDLPLVLAVFRDRATTTVPPKSFASLATVGLKFPVGGFDLASSIVLLVNMRAKEFTQGTAPAERDGRRPHRNVFYIERNIWDYLQSNRGICVERIRSRINCPQTLDLSAVEQSARLLAYTWIDC